MINNNDTPTLQQSENEYYPTIAPADIPKNYYEKSDSYGYIICGRILGAFFLSLIVAPLLFELSAWTILFSIPLLGVTAYKIQFILHDCSHNTLFKTKVLNQVAGTFAGLLIGVYFKMYRHTHMNHHRLNL